MLTFTLGMYCPNDQSSHSQLNKTCCHFRRHLKLHTLVTNNHGNDSGYRLNAFKLSPDVKMFDFTHYFNIWWYYTHRVVEASGLFQCIYTSFKKNFCSNYASLVTLENYDLDLSKLEDLMQTLLQSAEYWRFKWSADKHFVYPVW